MVLLFCVFDKNSQNLIGFPDGVAIAFGMYLLYNLTYHIIILT